MKFQPTKKISEAMIQAEFYQACKNVGLGCFLEYRAKWNGVKGSRFDAVVHDGVDVLAIVEIKAYKYLVERNMKDWSKTKQASKYRAYGVPVFLVACLDNIQPTIDAIIWGKP